MPMTHQEKLEAMYPHMEAIGVPKGTAAPPLWRLLWRMGIELPPPLFNSFASNALILGAFFGVCWSLAMWIMVWARQDVPFKVLALLVLLSGVGFGVFMAVYLRRLARRHRLTDWSAYAGAS